MSQNDTLLLESITNALGKIDKKGAAIRFRLSGEHIQEHAIVGNLDGYKVLGLRIAAAALRSAESSSRTLNLEIDDIITYKESDEAETIGFDTFVVDPHCEFDSKEWEKSSDSHYPEWLRFMIVLIVVCVPGYVFIEGIRAIWHKIFG